MTALIPPVYQEGDDYFKQYFPGVLRELDSYTPQLGVNLVAARRLVTSNATQARKLADCGRLRSAAVNPLGLRQAFYCRQYRYCPKCAQIRVSKITDKFIEGVHDYASLLNIKQIKKHEFVFHPRVQLAHATEAQFKQAGERVKSLKAQLAGIICDKRQYALSRKQLDRRLLGPAFMNVHAVPKNIDVGTGIGRLHLHMSLTSHPAIKCNEVFNVVKKAYARSCRELGEADEVPVKSELQRKAAQTIAIAEPSAVLRTIRYLAQPVKFDMGTSLVRKTWQMIELADIPRLWTMVGVQGKLADLPDSFDPVALEHGFIAKFDSGQWRTFILPE